MTNEQITSLIHLHHQIQNADPSEDALWQAIIAHQSCEFHTSSGLSFTYTLKIGRRGLPTNELLITRKEESKTLTKSSILYAYRKILENIQITQSIDEEGNPFSTLIPAVYKGPKAIGQIFGISYIYSIFLHFGLIRKS